MEVSAYETIRVLITVKAYPSVSHKYGEVCCVAGVRLDSGRPEFVRLFPVPFRYLDMTRQFQKYDVVELSASRHHEDLRPESWRPNLDTLTVVGNLPPTDGWARRVEHLRSLVSPSLCDIKRRQASDGTSLGLFRPAEVRGLELAPANSRSAGQQGLAAQMNLFDPDLDVLEELPYRFVYTFRCNDAGCKGHQIGLIDWEVGASYLNWRRRYSPAELPGKLRQKWFDEMTAPGRDLLFFTGNLARWPTTFVLLGAVYPSAGVMDQLTLF